MPPSIRQAIAKHMTYSKQNIPHYYLTMRAEVSAVVSAREEWNASHPKEQAISVNDLMIKALALALAEHPEFNGYYQNDEFQTQKAINIGIAIAIPEGLIAPALLNCRDVPLVELAQRSRDLAERARKKVLKAEEYTAATFTLTNLGMYHVESFTAIIVPPQVGILAIGAIETVPAILEGELLTAHRVALTLSADHRATDGVQGALFLEEVVSCLENPEKLFAS